MNMLRTKQESNARSFNLSNIKFICLVDKPKKYFAAPYRYKNVLVKKMSCQEGKKKSICTNRISAFAIKVIR